MTQKDKNLLLQDLCARLPYGVKFNFKYGEFSSEVMRAIYLQDYMIISSKENSCEINDIKPYLFPLSSMTEEQKEEISKKYHLHTFYGLLEITNHSEGYWDDDSSCHLQDYLWLIDWLNKNHFDYRGLIEKGLAIDATNLNIY